MKAMISVSIIRRAGVFIAAAVVVPVVALTASGCGGHTAAVGATVTMNGTTNGLEKKSPADVLQAAAAALSAAKSVHIVAAAPNVHVDIRMQGSSSTGTVTQADVQVAITIIGGAGYVKTDRAGLKMIGAPPPAQRQDAGRWVKDPAPVHHFTGLTLASFASQLAAYNDSLEPTVRQATLNGRKVVIVSWRDGSQLYVANTGPAYPLRLESKGQHPGRFDFTEYGVRFHITAPR